MFGDDVAPATSVVLRERRACLPSFGGREAAEASRIMFFIGHSARRLDVFRTPEAGSALERRPIMRARLQAADPGFAGALYRGACRAERIRSQRPGRRAGLASAR